MRTTFFLAIRNFSIHLPLDIFLSQWERGSIAGFNSEIRRGFEFILYFISPYITIFIAFWLTNYRKLQFYFPLFMQKFQTPFFILLHFHWHFIRNRGVLLILASDTGVTVNSKFYYLAFFNKNWQYSKFQLFLHQNRFKFWHFRRRREGGLWDFCPRGGWPLTKFSTRSESNRSRPPKCLTFGSAAI